MKSRTVPCFTRLAAVAVAGFPFLLTSQAGAAILNPDPASITKVVVRTRPAVNVVVNLTSPSGTAAWTATSSNTNIRVTASGTAPGPLTVTLDPAALTAAGDSNATITLRSGTDVRTIPVTMRAVDMRISSLTADLERPVVYAANQNGNGTGVILVIDDRTGEILEGIPVGNNSNAVGIDYRSGQLLVSHAGSQVRVLSLANRQLISTFTMPFTAWGAYSVTPGVMLLATGSSPALVNQTTGAVLSRIDSLTFAGGGSFVDLSGRYLFERDRIGAGLYYKVDLTTTPPTNLAHPKAVDNGPMSVSADGSRIGTLFTVHDAAFKPIVTLTEQIAALSYRGELALTSGPTSGVGTPSVRSVPGGQSVLTLPGTMEQGVFTGDQQRVVTYDSTNRVIQVFPLPPSAVPPLPGTAFAPADNSAVMLPLANLVWDQIPSALRYRVYFGNSAAAVAAATASSPEYRGETRGNTWTPPGGLAAGQSYFWRIDIVRTGSTTTGAVKQFSTLPASIEPALADASGITGGPPVRVPLKVTAAGDVTWEVSESLPWITVESPSGTGSGTATLVLSPAALAKNIYTANVTLTVNGNPVPIPVSFDVRALEIVKLEGEPGSSLIYGLNNDSETGHVVAIDAATGVMTATARVSDNPTDIDVAADGVYVICFEGEGKLHRFKADLTAGEVRTLTGLQNTGIGHDYRPRVAARGDGIVYWRDLTDYRPRVHTLNFETGAEVGTPIGVPGSSDSTGSDDIQIGPDGTTLLISGRQPLSVGGKYTLWQHTLAPAPVTAASTNAIIEHLQGSPILTAPGSPMVFAGEWGFRPAALRSPVSRFSMALRAATADGALVFSNTAIYRGGDGQFIDFLPAVTDILATNGADSLVYFAGGALGRLSLTPWKYDHLSTPPDGGSVSAMPSQLRIPAMPGEGPYEFYIGTSAAEVAAATPSDEAFFGTSELPEIALTHPGSAAEIYYWRADRAGRKGAVHRFTVRAAFLERLGELNDSLRLATDGDDLAISLPTTPPQIRLLRRAPRTDHFVQLKSTTAGTPGLNWNQITIKGDGVWMGSPLESPTEAGAAYYVPRGTDGVWGSPVRFTANTVRADERWSESIAAGDDYLAVGVPGYSTNTGCVDVMNPVTGARIVRLTIPGASNNQRNGMVVAASGEWIAARGYTTFSPSVSQTAVRLFRRTTGWAYHSMITKGGTVADTDFGSDIVIDGNSMAVTGGPAGSRYVRIYNLSGSGASLVQELRSPPGYTDISFGYQIALRSGLLAVAAPQDTAGLTAGTGRIYLYRKPAAPQTLWEPLAPVEMPNPVASNRGLGFDVAIGERYLFAYSRDPGGWASAAVFLVNPGGNRAPWIETALPQTAEAGKALVWPVTAREDDPDDTATLTIAAAPAFLTFSDGALRGTPAAAGSYNVDLAATDTRGSRTRQRFVLRVAAAGAVPVFTALPGDIRTGAGERLVLAADATTVAGLTWQWYYEGRPVPGATQKSLTFDHAGPADSGRWFVRMTYPTGVMDSPEFTVTVDRTASRFAGDWMTLGNDSGHRSYYPATFGTHTWRRRWKISTGTTALWEAPVSDGRIFSATVTSRSVKAWNARTGSALWTSGTGNSGFHSGPAASRFHVYTQYVTPTWSLSHFIQSLTPHTGTLEWEKTTTPLDLDGRYAPPVIVDDGVHFLTPSQYAGLNESGDYQFSNAESSATDNTPSLGCAVSGDRAATWIGGLFTLYSSATGQELGTLRPDPADTTSGGVPVMAGDTALVRTPSKLYAIDLPTRTVRWSLAATGSTLPALRDSEVYLMQGNTITARSAADGSLLRSFTAETFEPTSGFQALNHPVVTDDLLIATTPSKTIVFNRVTGAAVTTLADGGLPSLANGTLVLAGRDGSLAAYYAGKAPEISPADRVLTATEDQPFSWTLTPADFDGDTPALTVQSKPAWLTATAGPQNSLTLSGTPLQADTGSATVTVRSSDSSGDAAVSTFTINVIAVNDAPLAGAPGSVSTDEDTPAALDPRSPALATDEEDGAALTWSVAAVADPDLIEAAIDGTGSLRITPKPDQFGATTVSLTAADSGGLTVSVVIPVTINAVNDTPVAAATAPVILDEDAPAIRLPLAGIFTDIDDAVASLTLTISGQPGSTIFAPAVLNGGELIVAPLPDASGLTAVTVRATDAGGLFAEATWELRVLPVPDPPAVPLPAPPALLDPAAEAWNLNAAAFFSDPDPGERLTYSIEENTNAALFRDIRISADGLIESGIAPWRWGSARLRVKATGTDGLSVETWIDLTVPDLPPPAFTTESTSRLNRQTGLMELTVTVRNTGSRALGAYEIVVSGLPAGIEAYNASRREDDTWIVRSETELLPGASATIILEFYSPVRSAAFTPVVTTRAIMPEARPAADGAGLAIDRITQVPGGLLVEFASTPGKLYEMQWSNDGTAWKTSLVPLRAAGTRVQWIDRGLPRTDRPPLLSPQRFYRVKQH